MNTPSNYKLIYNSKEINDKIISLATEVSKWATQSGTSTANPLMIVPVLSGALFLCADLMRHLNLPLELKPIFATASNEEKNELLAKVTIKDLSGGVFNARNVLVVDDIFDSGKTTSELSKYLLKQGAAEVRSLVLVKRAVENQIGQPNWNGFTFQGKEWLVGYGMDDKGLWRNLPAIYSIVTS